MTNIPRYFLFLGYGENIEQEIYLNSDHFYLFCNTQKQNKQGLKTCFQRFKEKFPEGLEGFERGYCVTDEGDWRDSL